MAGTPARPQRFSTGLARPISRRSVLGLITAAATVAVLPRARADDRVRDRNTSAAPPPPAYHHIVGLL